MHTKSIKPILAPRVSFQYAHNPIAFLSMVPIEPNSAFLINESSYLVKNCLDLTARYQFRSNILTFEFGRYHLRAKSEVNKFLEFVGFCSQESFIRFGLTGYQLEDFTAVLKIHLVLFVELEEFKLKANINY